MEYDVVYLQDMLVFNQKKIDEKNRELKGFTTLNT